MGARSSCSTPDNSDVPRPSALAPERVKRSLRFSFLDGIFASGMVGFTQDYVTPFLLLLGGTARHVGLVSSIPHLAAAIIQLISAEITARVGSRKKVITTVVLFQAMVLVPAAVIAFAGGASVYWFIFLVTCYTALGSFALPPWGSFMSDLVPEKRRGEYFGWRNRALGLLMVAASFVAGALLHHFQAFNPFLGFAVIFVCACLFRLASWYFLCRMEEPPLIVKKEDYFSIWMFLRRVRESNFAKFVIFVSLFNFTVFLASPFFAVFMLRELKFNYLLYTMITVTATLVVYLTMSRWGRHADKVGNLKVLKFTAPLIAVLPLLWVFNQEPTFLFLVQCLSGFAWAGFNLCASNFIYDAVSPAKRTRCIAYFNVMNGLALCAGAFLGGFLLEHLPPLWGYRILTLFVISSILRMIVALWLPEMLREVRPVEKVSSEQLFFSMLKIKPLLGVERRPVDF